MDKKLKKYKFIEYVRYIDFIKEQLKRWITEENYNVEIKSDIINVIFYNDTNWQLKEEILEDFNKESRKIFPNLEFSIEIPKPCAGTATKWQRGGIIYKKGV